MHMSLHLFMHFPIRCNLLNLVKCLLQHEKALHALANALLEYETLNAEEIKRILVPYSGSELFVEQEQQVEAELVLA